MFTGIVEEIGKVKRITTSGPSAKLEIQCSRILDGTGLGDSIAVNGVCLTVTELTPSSFTADVMHETLNRSSLGDLSPGGRVNLERAMAADGRFGGHIVSGHIDGTGKVLSITNDANAYWYRIGTDSEILKYIVMKGSIAIDGISLTVAKLDDVSFSVSIIPHTLRETVLGDRNTGSTVNLENDIIAKYTERLLFGNRSHTEEKSEGITEEFLIKYGF